MRAVETKPSDMIIVAVDTIDINRAIELVKQLSPFAGGFKLGLGLFYSLMSRILLLPTFQAAWVSRKLQELGAAVKGKVFLDVGLNHTPDTVKFVSVAVAGLGVKMFNVHACSGEEAVKAAAKVKGRSLLFGETVLTSIGNEDCFSIFGKSPNRQVLQFSEMLLRCGADGIICSGKELFVLDGIPLLKAAAGICPKWYPGRRGERTATPEEAIEAGANYLIIGRPITNPPDIIGSPVEAVRAIAMEIDKAIHIPRLRGLCLSE